MIWSTDGDDLMSESLVIFRKIDEKTKESLYKCVDQACEQTGWFQGYHPKSLFIKINGMSSELIPGVSTSPWIFESTLQHIRKHYPNEKLYFGDSDGYGVKQVNKMVQNWGLLKLAKIYDVQFVNLSETRKEKVYIGPLFQKQQLPKILLEVDGIVNIPVGKTHGLSTVTASMKNLWGLLPKIRYRFHPVIHEAITEINGYFNKVVLNLCDMTIAMEGTGPRCGDRRVCDVIISSTDRVALDSVVARYMGFNPDKIGYIRMASERGIGKIEYRIVGDSFQGESFRPSLVNDHFLYRWRGRIQKIPVLRNLVFDTHFYFFAVKFAEVYNKKIYYYTKGKRILEWVKTETWYKDEYENIG